jgi:hypothetical protein
LIWGPTNPASFLPMFLSIYKLKIPPSPCIEVWNDLANSNGMGISLPRIQLWFKIRQVKWKVSTIVGMSCTSRYHILFDPCLLVACPQWLKTISGWLHFQTWLAFKPLAYYLPHHIQPKFTLSIIIFPVELPHASKSAIWGQTHIMCNKKNIQTIHGHAHTSCIVPPKISLKSHVCSIFPPPKKKENSKNPLKRTQNASGGRLESRDVLHTLGTNGFTEVWVKSYKVTHIAWKCSEVP